MIRLPKHLPISTYGVAALLGLILLLVGNSVVNSKDHQLFAQADPTATKEVPTHIMQPGESLADIAELYGVTEEALREFNGMTYVDFLFVGQPLLLPVDPESLITDTPIPPTPDPNATPTPRPPHTVKPGETLSEIAEVYDVSQAALRQYNGINDADQIYVGQELQLPPIPTAAPEAELQTEAETETETESADVDAESVSTAAPNPVTAANTITTTNASDSIETDSSVNEPLLPPIPYTIKRGETLSEIAKANGITTQALMALNGINDPDAIYAGQVLEMPPQPQPEPSPTPIVVATEAATEAATTETNDDALAIDDVTAITATAGITETMVLSPATEAGQPVASMSDPLSIQFADQNLTTSLNKLYTVRSGDSVNRIALRSGVDVEALKTLNKLSGSAVSNLSIGQQLIIPATEQETMVTTFVSTLSAQEAEQAENIYVVQPGDNLSTIAMVNDVKTGALMTANKIVNPDSVFVGQRLLIPPTPEPTPATVEADVEPGDFKPDFQTARRGYYYYTVNPGDTLSEIANQFDTTIMALIEYNGLPDEETVYQGLELRIPFGLPILNRRLPPAPSSGTQFVVSISRQECWLMRGDYIDETWPCSTGYGEWTTRLGSFQVKTRMELAKSSAYEMDMPYWLGIYDVGSFENGIHGLPVRWSTGEKVWSNLIGSPATYGCAMLHDDDAELLYNVSYLGMPVHIVE